MDRSESSRFHYQMNPIMQGTVWFMPLLTSRFEACTGANEHQDERNQTILDWLFDWLSPLTPWKKPSDVCEQRQTGTGQWLLDDPKFREWVRGTGKLSGLEEYVSCATSV